MIVGRKKPRDLKEVKPIRPEDVVTKTVIPDSVIEVFNELIVENFNQRSGSATVTQRDAIDALTATGHTDIIVKGLLDVEAVFRSVGWEVTYDKPGYNETYDAHFIFRKP